jgi:hypothetical protein
MLLHACICPSALLGTLISLAAWASFVPMTRRCWTVLIFVATYVYVFNIWNFSNSDALHEIRRLSLEAASSSRSQLNATRSHVITRTNDADIPTPRYWGDNLSNALPIANWLSPPVYENTNILDEPAQSPVRGRGVHCNNHYQVAFNLTSLKTNIHISIPENSLSIYQPQWHLTPQDPISQTTPFHSQETNDQLKSNNTPEIAL